MLPAMLLKGLANDRNNEPMVDERLGSFSDITIPVGRTAEPAYWGMDPTDSDYVTPQSQLEHNALLNTYYPYRRLLPNWRELGRQKEKQAKHYSSQDTTTRKPLGAFSSVVGSIVYDTDRNIATVDMGGTPLSFSATPSQLQSFLSSGSLGREISNILHNKSTSMTRTALR